MLPRMRRASLPFLMVVLLLGGVFRFCIVRRYTSSSPDGEQYHRIARELVRAKRFSLGPPPAPLTYSRLPGYPLFLALVAGRAQDSAQTSVFRAAVANTVLDLAVGLLLGLLLYEFAFPVWTGYVAFALVAFCPLMFLFASYRLSESLATFLGTLAFFLAVRSRKSASFAAAAACGLVSGAALLVRADMVTEIPALVLLLWNRSWPPKVRVKRTVVMLATIAIALLPWALRNTIQFGQLHITGAEWPAQDGEPLPTGPMQWMRTWAAGRPSDGDLSSKLVFRESFSPDQVVLPRMYDSADERAEAVSLLEELRRRGLTAAVNDRFLGLAQRRRRARPFYVFVQLPLARAKRLYEAPPRGDYPIRIGFLHLPESWQATFNGANAIIYLLALAGAVILLRDSRRRYLATAIIVAIAARTLLHLWAVPTFVCQRYLVEVMPLLILMCTVSLSRIVERAPALRGLLRPHRSVRTDA